MEKQNLVSAIMAQLIRVEPDIAQRNAYMNERDKVIYDEGLYDGLEFPDGVDRTMYNFCSRVVDIQTSQLMGRGFQLYSNYNKEDISLAENAEQPEPTAAPEGQEPVPAAPAPDPEKLMKLAEAKNKQRQLNADTRKKLVDAIIRDNGGMAIFKHGARIGSSYGITIFKTWLDKNEKKVKISLLETPQNYYPIWADSNFREREGEAYVDQISPMQAYKKYGDKLGEGEEFSLSAKGSMIGDAKTVDPINTLNPVANADTTEDESSKAKMCTRVDWVGLIPGWSLDDKNKPVEVDRGKEEPFCALIVGGHLVQAYKDQDYMPRYWYIPNKLEPRRSAGKSDLDTSAIDLNRTYLEVMSTWTTLFHKEIAPTYQAKGFEGQRIPQRKRKMANFVPMSPEQDISLISTPSGFGNQSQQLLGEIKDSFVRVTGIGRVLFDDPTINPTSNQALMTTLKGVVDIVEDKQSRWEPVIMDMFTDALNLASKLDKTIKDVVDEEGWFFYVRWPSVLRREDSTYQQMWLNRLTMGTTSLGTYLEAMGTDDVSEEIDRLRDEMANPLTAAVLAKQLGMLAEQVISPPSPQGPKVSVSLKGDLTPYQEANLASQQGFNNGPFPPTAGPQGSGGLAAQENADNVGFLNGNPFSGGTAIQQGPDGQPVQDQQTPTLTADQNTGQQASMPGSGQAQPVTPEGAVNQMAQRNGG